MKELAAKSIVLVLLRLALFGGTIWVLGADHNNDSHIFNLLSEKPILTHIVGSGAYSQYPSLLPLLFHALSFVLGEHWIRISFIFADVLIFIILSLRVSNFNGSYWERFYILGVFTAPATAIWAQDEIIAVLPLVALFAFDFSVVKVLSIALCAFFLLKNFYIFLPVAVWKTGEFTSIAVWKMVGRLNAYAAVSFVVMYIFDSSRNFVPKNAFTSSIWYFSNISPVGQKYLSLAAFSLFALYFVIFRYNSCSWKLKALLIFCAFLNFFYHVNFEYFLFVTLPALILFFTGLIGLRTLIAITVWYLSALSTNIFYAAAYSILKIKEFAGLHSASILLAFVLGILSLTLVILEMRRTQSRDFRVNHQVAG